MDSAYLLSNRKSTAILTNPAPSADIIEKIIQAAQKAPDHAGLGPSRLIIIQGDGLSRLGDLYEKSLLARDPQASELERSRCHMQVKRSPLIIAVIAKIVEHRGVPEIEQIMSSACTAHAILYSAFAYGYGAIWRTGVNAYDSQVKQGLNLASNEKIIGFIYIGSIAEQVPSSNKTKAIEVSYW